MVGGDCEMRSAICSSYVMYIGFVSVFLWRFLINHRSTE